MKIPSTSWHKILEKLHMQYDIQFISAPSVLGLASTGVERLPERFFECGLAAEIKSAYPVITIPTYNNLRRDIRDSETHCLNTDLIRDFSIGLADVVQQVISGNQFAFILGGDCSILLGIMKGLKSTGTYGLVFIDAHADFYQPERSTTGEVADMDLALVTGRGPGMLSNINDVGPYVRDEHVIHIGQRDEQQTIEYGSQDIRDTKINCQSLAKIRSSDVSVVAHEVVMQMNTMDVDGFWIHFDADVLSDSINPAVDYRLPDGLTFEETSALMKKLLSTRKIAGISVTIYNANLDPNRTIAQEIVKCLADAFRL